MPKNLTDWLASFSFSARPDDTRGRLSASSESSWPPKLPERTPQPPAASGNLADFAQEPSLSVRSDDTRGRSSSSFESSLQTRLPERAPQPPTASRRLTDSAQEPPLSVRSDKSKNQTKRLNNESTRMSKRSRNLYEEYYDNELQIHADSDSGVV